MKKFVKITMRIIGIALFDEALVLAFCAWYNNVSFWFPEYVEYGILGMLAAAAWGMTLGVEKLIERIGMINWLKKNYIRIEDGRVEKVKAR